MQTERSLPTPKKAEAAILKNNAFPASALKICWPAGDTYLDLSPPVWGLGDTYLDLSPAKSADLLLELNPHENFENTYLLI